MSSSLFPVVSTRRWYSAALLVSAAVILTRLPFRSHFLFSWDSVNFALAMERIDIAAHRPHPPGYLGYVFIARGFDWVLGDANAALVAWNVLAAAIAVLLFLWMASELGAAEPHPRRFVAAAVSAFATSPLLWFYSEVAEIYVSELLVTLLIASSAWRVRRGDAAWLYVLAFAVPVAAVFKLTAALLMLPLAAAAWYGAREAPRRRALALFAGCVIAASLPFIVQPGFITMTWTQFTSATAGTRLSGNPAADLFERLNQNGRDTLLSTIGMLGVVNVLALVVWVARDRRLPRHLDRATALLWLAPWLVLCVAVHIAKPGYFLPALPVLSLLVASVYSRFGPTLGVVLVALQVGVNTAHFTALSHFPPSITGGTRPYRSKTLLQRAASDLQPLTFPTASTVRRTDAMTATVLTAAAGLCPEANGILITNGELIDVRRLMWYLPGARVVHLDGAKPVFVAEAGAFRTLGAPIETWPAACPTVWLVPDAKERPAGVPLSAAREPGVGFVIVGRAVRVSANMIEFD